MALLINRNYALLWMGQAISLLGDAVLATTLVLWIATRIAGGASWAPAAVGALVVAQKIPEILVGPPAGVFADRWPKKRTMLTMDAARAVLLGSLIVITGGLPLGLGASLSKTGVLAAIYATVLLATICSQFFSPSRIGLIGDIVPDEHRPRASGLAQSSNALSIFFLQQNLHAGARFFGLLGLAQGGGTLLGAVVAGAIGARLGVARLLWIAAVLFGLLTLVFSRLSSLPPALILIGLIAARFAIMQVCTSPLLLRSTPRAYIGRVTAILYPSFSVSDTVSALAAGWLASTVLRGFHGTVFGLRLGPIDTIFVVAGLLALAAGVYAMVNLREAVAESVEVAPREVPADVASG